MKRTFLKTCFICVLFAPSAFADGQTIEAVEDAQSQVIQKVSLLRATPEDLSLSSSWGTELTIPAVERTLEEPLEAAADISSWTVAVLNSNGSSDHVQWAADLLASTEPATSPEVLFSTPSLDVRRLPPDFLKLPENLRASILQITNAIQNALPLLKRSYADLSEEERNEFLALQQFPSPVSLNVNLTPTSEKRRIYGNMRKFRGEALMLAAGSLSRAADAAIPALQEAASSTNAWIQNFKNVRFETAAGAVIISGTGDDIYDAETLKSACLLIDLGGNNIYRGPVAGAREGEIRLAIDLGKDVSVEASTSEASAGAGIFGIGLFYLENPSGTKQITTGSYSQGCGLCGVGGLFSTGRGAFYGDRYVQGSGTFGAGIFTNRKGPECIYQASLYAQGAGFTRGVGIFVHEGNNASLRAGLVQPDPREPLGATSLCQGVGFGIRRIAGGGVGLCAIRGDKNSLESSYFAQGAGYWHGAGAFLIEGSMNTVKARRYGQGSGIHSAAGVFVVKGDSNRLINWGVGPAYGWDNGLGWGIVLGNDNQLQAEWGALTAANNRSRSFFVLNGERNILDYSEIASAGYTRDLSDYAVSVIRGEGNILKAPRLKRTATADQDIFYSPWGLISMKGVILEPETGLKKPSWDGLPDAPSSARKETLDLASEIRKAETLPADEKIKMLHRVASVFSVDKAQPRFALAHLAMIPDEEIPLLLRQVDPGDLEGFIQVMSVAGILGDRIAKPLMDAIKEETDTERKTWLIPLLANCKTERVIFALIEELQNDDWRIEASAAKTLGNLMNTDGGDTPGRVHNLKALAQWLEKGADDPKLLSELRSKFSKRSFAETAAIFSLSGTQKPEERIGLLESAPEDIAANMSEDGVEKMLNRLKSIRPEALDRISKEIFKTEHFSIAARAQIVPALQQAAKSQFRGRNTLVHSLATALGNIGHEKSIPAVSSLSDDVSALVRDGASAALGRIGKQSLPFLKKMMASDKESTRIQALCSIRSTTEPDLLDLLETGLKDPSPLVRKASVSMVNQIQKPLEKKQERLRARIIRSNTGPQSSEIEIQSRYLMGDPAPER